jgi:hypothetical protein
MPRLPKKDTTAPVTTTESAQDTSAVGEAPAEITAPEVIIGDTPPKVVKFNQYGLIEGEKYVFNEDGTINWRKMISPEFLVPNRQALLRKGKSVPDTTESLDDSELLILLGGIKKLAQLRGYCAVRYNITVPSEDYVVAVCSIDWIPNYENTGCSNVVTFSAIGDAHERNTSGFGAKYLGPIAENRAFVRAVRNFLKINIVSQEEIGGPTEGGEDLAVSKLKDTMKETGVSFDLIKTKLIEEKFPNAEGFTKVEDIPRYMQFQLIERIRKKAAEREKNESK